MKPALFLLFSGAALSVKTKKPWFPTPEPVIFEDGGRSYGYSECQHPRVDEKACGTEVVCEMYLRDLDGSLFYPYTNDDYPSRKACLEDHAPNPNRTSSSTVLQPWREPSPSCQKQVCTAANIHRHFHGYCGTAKYCRLFEDPAVRATSDAPYQSESECLAAHETREDALARSAGKTGIMEFLTPPCPEIEPSLREDFIGTVKYCHWFWSPLWRSHAWKGQGKKYASEEDCLRDRSVYIEKAKNDAVERPVPETPPPSEPVKRSSADGFVMSGPTFGLANRQRGRRVRL
ncbi:hypothetical protein JDV02_005653 [Purpureocillium takamizusanense]|uniref:Uncharacterized protein n=1 Tax=Purpureocillium takamizusanense TaxID=2060973 RepID=A0A9Q8QIH7_9HYPO|nr:uncharacterized protein JDV02_005653 [Purpureocillium takamizusanense]UNI19471.1 hypothetical protein JDV02_005653 [Purpureocillium takamizusanense]